MDVYPAVGSWDGALPELLAVGACLEARAAPRGGSDGCVGPGRACQAFIQGFGHREAVRLTKKRPG